MNTGSSEPYEIVETEEQRLVKGEVDFSFSIHDTPYVNGEPKSPLCSPPLVGFSPNDYMMSYNGSAAFVLCAEREGSFVSVCVQQRVRDPVLGKAILDSFEWGKSQTTSREPVAMQRLSAEGILSGDPDRALRTNDRVNRAEFSKIVLKAVDVQGEGDDGCFADVPSGQWFTPFVCKAKDLGFLNGYSDGTFKPADNISFAEAAKIVSNAFELNVDMPQQGPWYAPYVYALAEAGAIPETITSVDLMLTRGEVAEIVYRLLRNITDQPSRSAGALLNQREPF
jgi:hypothetical protein